jgi:hypothetical protein
MSEYNLFFDLPLDIQQIVFKMIKDIEEARQNKQKFDKVIGSFTKLKESWNDCFILAEDYDYIVRPQYIDNREIFNQGIKNNFNSFLHSQYFFEVYEFL